MSRLGLAAVARARLEYLTTNAAERKALLDELLEVAQGAYDEGFLAGRNSMLEDLRYAPSAVIR